MRSGPMPCRWSPILTLAGAIFAAWPSVATAQPRRPVYVGAKVCATCHDGANMGHQTTRWLETKHARAYAGLAAPEARAIAAISGVPIEPQKSPLCLGCHATGAEAEATDMDDTFSIRDGVQCELRRAALVLDEGIENRLAHAVPVNRERDLVVGIEPRRLHCSR